MSDAPERIWACASKNTKSGVVTLLGDATFPVDGWQEYVRADAIAALAEQLAAARRDAEEAEAYAGELEAKLAKAVEAERERCAKIADKCKRENGPLSKKGFNEQYRRGLEAAGQAIAAAIRAELTGGKDE